MQDSFGELLVEGTLGAFLKKCVEVLDDFCCRMVNCLSDDVFFDVKVTPNFTLDRFINDLNMAMSCHKEGEAFATKLEGMLNEDTGPH